MLRIFLGEMPEAVYHPPTFFDNQYQDKWITDPLTVEMIKDIDNSDVVSTHMIESPILGPIPVRSISGGVKTLILFRFDESGKVFNASACGDNCAKWILRIAENKDLTINLRHVMDFGDGEFEVEILNTGEKVYNALQFSTIAGRYV